MQCELVWTPFIWCSMIQSYTIDVVLWWSGCTQYALKTLCFFFAPISLSFIHLLYLLYLTVWLGRNTLWHISQDYVHGFLMVMELLLLFSSTFHSFLAFRKKWGTQSQVIMCKIASVCLYTPFLSDFLPFLALCFVLMFINFFKNYAGRLGPGI